MTQCRGRGLSSSCLRALGVRRGGGGSRRATAPNVLLSPGQGTLRTSLSCWCEMVQGSVRLPYRAVPSARASRGKQRPSPPSAFQEPVRARAHRVGTSCPDTALLPFIAGPELAPRRQTLQAWPADRGTLPQASPSSMLRQHVLLKAGV